MILPSKSTTTHIETNFDDTGRAEAEAFISEIEGDGAKAGEVLAEVAAKAESANSGAQELAGRVKRLEDARGEQVSQTVWWSGAGEMPVASAGSSVVNVSTGEVWAV